jgi:hypothetical protein
MGLAAESVRVPDFSAHEPYLAPPLFLESAPAGLFVRGKIGDAAGKPGERIDWLADTGEALVPTALPEVHSGSPAPVSVVAYWFGETDAAALKIGAQVLSEEGRPLGEGAIRVLEKSPESSDGRQVLVVAFTPEQLSPGRYSLRVFLRDDATGRGGHASAPFLVR